MFDGDGSTAAARFRTEDRHQVRQHLALTPPSYSRCSTRELVLATLRQGLDSPDLLSAARR